MKKLTTLLACTLMAAGSMAQGPQTYKTFIYTSDDLANEIVQKERGIRQAAQRGYVDDLMNAGLAATKGIASGYVTSFIDLGVNAVGSLVTRNSRLKKEWEETVKAENVYETTISTVSEMNDFYKEVSFDGAMDPKGMRFDGIGCLRTEGKDTVFYISCHIDRSKIHRIINHSKFELVLDTLITSPTRSNLPNTKLNIPFSFKDRKNFNLAMNIRFFSSWMNEIMQLQKNQELGAFTINIPVDEKMLDPQGYLRYVRGITQGPAYKIMGESFIIPRSFSGYRDENDTYMNCWGTGEYKFSITLKETCDVTDQYRENWKKDRKQRKELQEQMEKEDKNFLEKTWQTISSQKWDELTQSWVITTLKAPASIITTDLLEEMGLTVATPSSSATKAAAKPTATQSPAAQGGATAVPQGGGKPQQSQPTGKPQHP